MNAKILRHITAIFLIVIFCLPTEAITLEEAKKLYRNGDYETPLPEFQAALKKRPKDASLNQWVGVCLYHQGRPEEATKYLKLADSKNVIEAPRYLALMAFDNYEFANAENYLDRYRAALTKAKREMPVEMEEFADKVSRAKAMFDRVENIVIIDSIAVDREEFLSAYRLSPESGSINNADFLPDDAEIADPAVVYMPESRQTMIWAAPDDEENYVLMTAAQLYDGTWEKPHILSKSLNSVGGDSNYPFLMQDGITLYYANDGEESIGGYDIFISRKGDDGFLQPQNLGMPYNSPFDDYMLAIDETTGVGWWATDRNQLGDSITIYVFIPSELRKNYPVDSPGLAAKAKVSDYRSTWEEGKDYSDKLEAIEAIKSDNSSKGNDFYFAMPGGEIYTSWSDFKSSAARNAMDNYLDAKEEIKATEEELSFLRMQYRDGDTSAKSDILSLEHRLEEMRRNLRKLSNAVVLAERR
ncbi:MAG: tetratricopeptide repeat protein [Muribaculum sp.]|nr:tetratricopeptide repeat protein [Muribaculum sp.]